MPKTDRLHLYLLLFLFLLGMTQVTDYGLSCDEPLEMGSVKFALEHVLYGKPIPVDLKYYGIVFHVLSEILFQAGQYAQFGLAHSFFGSFAGVEPSDVERVASLVEARMIPKHALTFTMAVITMGAAGGLARGLLGFTAVPLTIVCLALMPRFWGHAFFNPKDIPFAAMLTLGCYLGWRFVNFVSSPHEQVHRNKKIASCIGLGAFIGLATGTRIGAFLLLAFIPLAHIGSQFPRGRWRGWLRCNLPIYLLVAAAWFVVTILVHPASWSRPHVWFFKAASYLSEHAYNQKVLFQGQEIRAHLLPRTYLPYWMVITVPILWQGLALFGISALLRRWPTLSLSQRSALVLVLLQLLAMPSVAVIKGATVYDGMRHFLFVLPMLAVLSACGFVCLHRAVRSKPARVIMIAVALVYAGWIGAVMVRLHPYQYTYFNFFAGGLKDASTNYETDYWGLSLKEGMEWLNQHAEQASDIIIGGVIYSAKIFARPDLRILPGKIGDGHEFVSSVYPFRGDLRNARLSSPHYYLAHNRLRMMQQRPECEIIHEVTRDGATLALVRRCP